MDRLARPNDHAHRPAAGADDGPSTGGIATTRRQAVHAGVAVGAAAWVAGGAASLAGAVTGDRDDELRIPRDAIDPGEPTRTFRAPRRFDLLGARADDVRGLGLRVRARAAGGRWSPWRSLGVHDGHAPDGEAATMADPLWFAGAREVQVRARRRPDTALRLRLVTVPTKVKRASARAVRREATSTRRAAPRSAGDLRVDAPAIIPRSVWATGLRPRATPAMGDVQVAFVHHTVNRNDYAREESAAIVRAITEYHVRSNGWNDIGYNFVVDRFGQIFEGRAGGMDQPVVGAQAAGWNSFSTGIAIIGDFTATRPPDAALDAVAALIRWKLAVHGVPTAGSVTLTSIGGSGNQHPQGRAVTLPRVVGHRDGTKTDCPGAVLYGLLPELRRRVGGTTAPAVALTLEGPDDPVDYGGRLALAGRLTVGGEPAPGCRVTVQKRGESGRWVDIGAATTAADGSWSVECKWRRAAPVRAVWDGHSSPEVTPPIRPRLSLEQPTRRVRKGSRVRVRGRARGVDVVDVYVRRRVNGEYRVVARRRLKVRGSRVTGRVPVRGAGVNRIRVEVRTGGHTYRSPTRYMRAVR
ncbi:MAG: N-acetylmuramoyl-L-alanine amidase [Solirubrobacteraceae bacterium]|nr:N-acetylmuramoyl-L-alanine amidase [Solirubrobacteraceae bacterium]